MKLQTTIDKFNDEYGYNVIYNLIEVQIKYSDTTINYKRSHIGSFYDVLRDITYIHIGDDDLIDQIDNI